MGAIRNLKFYKSERLKNVKQIDNLFKNSSAVKAYPLVFTYLNDQPFQQSPFQVLFAAPKRNFKKAVERNRVKRVIRDRFRLIKTLFIECFQGKNVSCAFIYTSKDLPDYKQIDRSLLKIIKGLKEINDKTGA